MKCKCNGTSVRSSREIGLPARVKPQHQPRAKIQERGQGKHEGQRQDVREDGR